MLMQVVYSHRCQTEVQGGGGEDAAIACHPQHNCHGSDWQMPISSRVLQRTHRTIPHYINVCIDHYNTLKYLYGIYIQNCVLLDI